MKRFTHFNEAFNSPYKIDMKRIYEKQYRGKAKLKDGSILNVSASRYDSGSSGKFFWEIIFNRGGEIDVTGEGDQMKVFATVIDAIRQFIKQEDPEKFIFTADKSSGESSKTKDKESREKLYSRLIKRFLSKGYNVKERTDKHGTTYVCTKK